MVVRRPGRGRSGGTRRFEKDDLYTFTAQPLVLYTPALPLHLPSSTPRSTKERIRIRRALASSFELRPPFPPNTALLFPLHLTFARVTHALPT